MKGMVFNKGECGYKDFPKTACTSIKTAIYKVIEGESFEQCDEYDHIHAYSTAHKRTIDQCKKRFVVIRDPIKRFLSAYGNRVGFHGELSDWFIAKNYSNLYDKCPHFDPGVGQFIDNLKFYCKVGPIKHHVRPITEFLEGKGLNYFTDIYKIEELSKFEGDLTLICEDEVKFGREQTGGRKLLLKDLSRSQMETLIKYYKKDYKLLKDYYSIDSIWAEWNGTHRYSSEKIICSRSLVKKSLNKINSDHYQHLEVWKIDEDPETNLCVLHGLFVSGEADGLSLVVGSETVKITSNLASPNFRDRSSLVGSNMARFESEPFLMREKLEIWMQMINKKRIKIMETT